MFLVYWSEGEAGTPHSRAFEADDMRAAMLFMEDLRSRQRAGEAVGFVTMCSENPHSVGHPGVADPPADYDWKKRRR